MVKIAKWVLMLGLVLLYLLSFDAPVVFMVITAVLFAYIISPLADLFVNFLVWLFGKPVILKEREDIVKNGIPSDANTVLFRPVFVKTIEEMDNLLNSMCQDIRNNQEANRCLKFVVVDNTRDEEVKRKTRERIEQLQKEFGRDVVFYFHRNVKCDFFKKLGIYEDAIMLLREGWTRPKHYIDKKWEQWSKGTRNPDLPTWDVILGDVSALGIESPVSDILAGKEIKINEKKAISVAFVSDADNVWPKGSIRKMVAKIVHPENKEYIIWQPTINISKPYPNFYVTLSAMGRDMTDFDPITRWRIFHFSPFYGKGVMQVEGYVRDIIKAEPLHPGRAASHDFQEALHTPTVLVEDVYVEEKTFSNKLSELMRDAQWRWGDMETVRQFLMKKFSPGRKLHLYTLLRGLIGDLVYDLWLATIITGFMFTNLMSVKNATALLTLLCLYGLFGFIIPKFIVPLIKKKNIITTVKEGVTSIVYSCLLHQLDLIYKPRAVVRNFINQTSGKPFVWKTGAMGEMETANMTSLTIYKKLWEAPLYGIILLVIGIFTSPYLLLFLLPFIISFIFGPLFVHFVTKP